MKLVIFNGSPRYKKSNSKILIEQFLLGFHKVNATEIPIHYLAIEKHRSQCIEAYKNAEYVILIFPLYTDCMPAIVKEFFEAIALLEKDPNKKVGFIVQSGFPEAHHSVFVERYLEKLSRRLNFEYLGTIIRGGVEGIQIMPEWMTKKLFQKFQDLGEYFAKTTTFSEEIDAELRKPYKMSALRRFMFDLFSKTGLTNFYWNTNLKKHKAYEKRFDQPYAEN